MDKWDFGVALIVARELTGLGKCVRACVPACLRTSGPEQAGAEA